MSLERNPPQGLPEVAPPGGVKRGVQGKYSKPIFVSSVVYMLNTSSVCTQVEQAVREIKRLLIEASTAALQAEARAPQPTGRYSVL